MADINTMSNQEVIDFLKTRDHKAGMNAVSAVIENAYKIQGIEFFCPECGSDKRVSNGKTRSGFNRYKCKDCGKNYTALTNTVFEGTDYSWDEMVEAVYDVITKQSVEYLMNNIRQAAES